MNLKEFYYKCKDVSRSKIVMRNQEQIARKKYLMRYSSYRNSKKRLDRYDVTNNNYLAARPNPGAGIGHQMANWIAGYWFARQFGLNFAHLPFSSMHTPYKPNKWDSFLGFAKGEAIVEDLCKKGYKKIRLPQFDEYKDDEVEQIRKIIVSYTNQKVVFIVEQDQFYHDQYGVMDDLQRKFYNAKARNSDKIIYDKNNYNIAIHVRRGDIVQNEGQSNDNLSTRWLDNNYFVNALRNTLDMLKTDKSVHIFLFSQGNPGEYKEFLKFRNMHLCLDMSAEESFLNMCFADVLITSKSSFSYKPALLNKGIKVCPVNFWHGYPDANDWILVDDEGNFIK